jgi:hypothetical protein
MGVLIHNLVRNWLVGIGLVLVACQPTATPFPVDIPTPATATPTPGPPVPLRYGLSADAAGALHDPALLESGAQMIQIEEAPLLSDLGTRFDVIAAYGLYPDFTPSPVQAHLALVINTELPPLDNPALADVLLRSLDPAALASAMTIPGIQPEPRESLPLSILRAELANAGWPDGFDLWLAHQEVVGVIELQAHLRQLNIHTNPVPLQDREINAHLTLIIWTIPEQRDELVLRVGDNGHIVDLLTLPISYLAVPGLDITFSPQGWPIATRP